MRDETVVNKMVLEARAFQQAALDPIVLETVRRYRAAACLCRRTAAFRPAQQSSLLEQAEHWERLAIREIELHREPPAGIIDDESEPAEPQPEAPQVETRWWLPRREGLFAGLPC